MTRLVALTLDLSSAALAVVQAVPRNDLATLKNGDGITCEVTGLRRGLLEAWTDDSGTIPIECACGPRANYTTM